jgi:O-acetyl-ADP-ribose deacetylase (regulator of RNase III)
MSIIIVNKNIVESDAVMVLHQVNCQHAMGSGVAKAIKEKWPIVYNEYMDIKEQKLGDIQVVKVESNKYVVNMFAQEYYGYDGKRYTSYDALDTCLKKVAKICEEEGIKKVAIPYNMSCDRGGASWNVVVCLIEEAFKNKKINIELCKYGEK